MNARDAIKELERVGRGSLSIPAFEATLSGLRLLDTAEANDGTTPETDKLRHQPFASNVGYYEDVLALAGALEQRCTGLAAEVVRLTKDAKLYCEAVSGNSVGHAGRSY